MKKGTQTHTHTARETGPHSSLCYATQDAVRILPILGLISAISGTDPLYWALVSRDTLSPEHIQQSQQAIPHAHTHTHTHTHALTHAHTHPHIHHKHHHTHINTDTHTHTHTHTHTNTHAHTHILAHTHTHACTHTHTHTMHSHS